MTEAELSLPETAVRAPAIAEAAARAAGQRGDAYGILRLGDVCLGIALEYLAEVAPVPGLSPLMLPAEGLRGALDLRGTLIPMLDLAELCGTAGPARVAVPAGADDPPKLSVILRHGGRLMAIGIDEIVGLAHRAAEEVQPFAAPPPARPGDASPDGLAAGGLVAGGFVHEGRVVTVIAVPAIFARAAIPSVPARRAGASVAAAAGSTREPALSFVAGGATFAARATEIHGTVPRRAIDRNSLTSGACLGSVIRHGRRIPVLDATRALGLGQPAERETAEVVVLRFPEDRLLGFAVDTILQMIRLDPSRLVPAPRIVGPAHDVLSHVMVDDAGTQVFLIDTAALHARPQMVEYASISDTLGEDAPRSAAAGVGPRDVVMERVRYLVYEAGCRTLASPIHQIARIVEPPQNVVHAAAARPGLDGFFAHDGRTIPLVSLPRLVGMGARDSAVPRVLLVGDADRRIGFTVDAVLGIETSAWRTGDGQSSQPEIVQVGSGEARRILPRLDLQSVTRELLG